MLHIETDDNLDDDEVDSNLGNDEFGGNIGDDEPVGMDEDRKVSSPHCMIQGGVNFKQSTPPLSFETVDTKVCKSMLTRCICNMYRCMYVLSNYNFKCTLGIFMHLEYSKSNICSYLC